jgi:CheY-like chemotaxis protein
MARILVVDDVLLMRELIADMLRLNGHDAVACATGPQALAALRAEPPAACVVDQQMPGMTGAQFIEALRASNDPLVRGVPVIGLTAGDGRELRAAGAVTCVRKPFTELELSRAVALALGLPAVA